MPQRAPAPVRHVDDAERRARVAIRHRLALSHRSETVEPIADAVVALHSTDPPSVHLSCWARGRDISVDDVERAIYADRSIVRQMCLRQTLFVLPRDLMPAVLGSICPRMADRARTALLREVAQAEVDTEPAAWIDTAAAAVLAELAREEGLTGAQIRQRVPEAVGSYAQGAGTRWASTVQLTPKLLTLLHLQGRIIRCGNDGPWHTSRPRWAATESWLGPVSPLPEQEGYAELVRRYLHAHGPATVDDAAWWIGATKGAVRTALADLTAVPVSLDGTDQPGWLLPDDLDPVGGVEPWVALLPLLDPAVMGWRERGFLLAPHQPLLFDSVGNAGTTVLIDGRVVGVWVQDADQVVQLRLLKDVPTPRRRELEAEAERLTSWLDGQRVFTVYPSPAMRD